MNQKTEKIGEGHVKQLKTTGLAANLIVLWLPLDCFMMNDLGMTVA